MPRILVFSLIGSVLALLLFAWLAAEVTRGNTAALDTRVRVGLHSLASPVLTAFFRLVTQLGSVAVQLIGTPLIVLAFWRLGWKHRAILYVVAMSGGGLLLYMLKHLFHRARPEAYFGYPLPANYSFPSGHALLSFCFYGVLAAFLAEHQRHRARQIAVWTVAAILILLIGISRIYLSVHYFTDVLAGYIAAFIWTTGITWGYHRLSREQRLAPKS